MAVKLLPHQEKLLSNDLYGKVVWGGVGSGKSIAILAYYIEKELGYARVVVITTAKKRDSLEWEKDAALFGIGKSKETSVAGVLTVDSWNNISKYEDWEDTFFILDEQRVVGNGAWVKSFQKIAKNKSNFWTILSATPGDTWTDYIPIFVANGFFKNPTQFAREHIVYARFSRYPRIERFIGVPKLERLKANVLVEMPFTKHTTRIHESIECDYDQERFNQAFVKRWNPLEDRPIRDVADMFAVGRKISYGDPSRFVKVCELREKHPKLIIFYNYNYELHILRELEGEVAEWNGHRKQPIPKTESWVYLVQYTAGAEGWNCTDTDAMVFYSLPYSYKKFEQAQGRIDRLNTHFHKLFYYALFSKSAVDRAVRKSLDQKETFNEKKWARENGIDLDDWDMWNE